MSGLFDGDTLFRRSYGSGQACYCTPPEPWGKAWRMHAWTESSGGARKQLAELRLLKDGNWSFDMGVDLNDRERGMASCFLSLGPKVLTEEADCG